MLFDTLMRICAMSRKDVNKKQDSTFSITLLINALSHHLSLKSNKMQKLICIYLKAKGVSKSCFFFLQRAGLSLSYEWFRQALEKISAAAMAEVINLFEIHPCIAMHGNIWLAYPIKHERGSHKTVTDNGTAMTVIPMNDKERAKKLLWDVNSTDQHWEWIAKRY
ncbi:unnamed protein product [Rhizoctonia solani]|uniref:Uncharacterized protein n=1 Tax=Rhizoctonia solani TaxID=456999 RepID=A0A8H3HH00_9AGAM|nr:unnamed protein product [Rhizoctonia solani]